MSWLFSRALGVACSQDTSLDGPLCALLSAMSIVQAYWCNDKTTDTFRRSRYGLTFVPLTERAGEALLTSFLAASRASHSRARPEAGMSRKTSGRKCGASWQMSLPGVSLPRTWRKGQSTTLPTISGLWISLPAQFAYPRATWVVTTFGPGTGFLHTPTAAGNYCAPSMQKHACAREFTRVFGSVTPEAQEYLMDWPIGWSALEPLETDKFHAWRSPLSLPSQNPSSEAA